MCVKNRSILIIVNPTAGRGRGLRTARAVADHLRARDVPVDLQQTDGAGAAARITEALAESRAPLPDCVVACGGDGTVQEIASALASMKDRLEDRCPALGLAPAGRCNDFARALGVPKSPDAIADILATGKAAPIDLGRANGRFFCTVATLGIDAEVTSYVDSMRMPLKGPIAYIYGALRVLWRYRACTVHISGEFGDISRAVFLASSANTCSYGGAIPIAPDAVPTDGMLDVCVVAKVSRLRALRLIPKFLSGKHVREPEVQLLRAARFTITTDEPIELWADGEPLTTTPVEIEAVPAAVRVVVPANRPQPPGPASEDRVGESL